MVTASQAVKMYELLNKHFKNNEDAKAMVASIEDIVDNKFNSEKDRLATKHDIYALKDDIFAIREDTKKEIFVLREDTKKFMFALKEDVYALQARMEQGFKDQLKWLIVLMVGLSSLAVAIIKLT
jgi:hypothetical protein